MMKFIYNFWNDEILEMVNVSLVARVGTEGRRDIGVVVKRHNNTRDSCNNILFYILVTSFW